MGGSIAVVYWLYYLWAADHCHPIGTLHATEEVTRYGWVIPARPGSNITFAQDIVTCDDGSVRNGYGHDISKSRVWGNQYPIARKLRDMPVCDPGQHEVLPRLSQIRCVAD